MKLILSTALLLFCGLSSAYAKEAPQPAASSSPYCLAALMGERYSDTAHHDPDRVYMSAVCESASSVRTASRDLDDVLLPENEFSEGFAFSRLALNSMRDELDAKMKALGYVRVVDMSSVGGCWLMDDKCQRSLNRDIVQGNRYEHVSTYLYKKAPSNDDGICMVRHDYDSLIVNCNKTAYKLGAPDNVDTEYRSGGSFDLKELATLGYSPDGFVEGTDYEVFVKRNPSN